MKLMTRITVMAWALVAAPLAYGQILYDNASSQPGTGTFGLVTNPGAGFGGGHLSALVAPDGSFGFNANTAFVFRIADNFTVPAGFTWTVSGANFFGYTTGATATTLIGATVRFFNGSPALGGAVIAGDTTTNIQTAVAFALDGVTPIFRAQATTPTLNNRQIQMSTATLGASLVLNPGTYWIDYALTSSTGALFSAPISLPTAAITGDALQFDGTNYVPLTDVGGAKGIPFQLIGTSAAIPEPGTWALMGVTLVGLATYVNRSRKNRKLALDGKLIP